ncbi:unnamed protein product [Meloidogyne enterolobii]|uniref:Uncharacterized protein n=1 Tax=Meloidogyne enterolobii TaxID=390850 RepID=A0ACB0YNM6_MELEN
MDNHYQSFLQVFHLPKCLEYQHVLLNIPLLDLLDQQRFQLTDILHHHPYPHPLLPLHIHHH